jgi:diketogulonate reductase-like aldo/keto reductase
MDEIPAIGFGTWQLADGQEVKDAVATALRAGYRLIDTAKLYANEKGVGEAIAASGLPRQQIFITTKLWNDDQGYDSARRAFAASLKKLSLDYIDLYLIHWPGHDPDSRRDSWRALLELNDQGTAKAIGVSNYAIQHIEELLDYSPIRPAVNQIEFHPFVYEQQKPIVDFCNEQGIIVEAYSPLASGGRINHPSINKIADKYGKTNAQIVLRWCLQHATIPLPRSTNPEHIKQNINIFDFELSPGDVEKINGLSNGRSVI